MDADAGPDLGGAGAPDPMPPTNRGSPTKPLNFQNPVIR